MSFLTCDRCGRFHCQCIYSEVIGVCNSIAQEPPKKDPPMNKIFRVQIFPNNAPLIEKHVVARNEKSALLKVIEDTPEDDPTWSAAGWRSVQVYEASKAFVL